MSCTVLCLISKSNGPWKIQIHSRHGSKSHDQKHIHIKRRGLKGEYSWNIDGSRHDSHRFPVSDNMIEKAKAIAAKELGISADTLQLITSYPGGLYLNIAQVENYTKKSRNVMNTYIRTSETFNIFEAKNGIVVVILNQPKIGKLKYMFNQEAL